MVLVVVAGGVFVAELFSRRRSRRIHASLARITPALKGRRHPDLDLEIAELHSYGDIVWILFRGADAAKLPPYLGFEQIAKHEAALGRAVADWLRTLNAELKTKTLADGWAPRVGFESVDRVAGDLWSYFK